MSTFFILLRPSRHSRSRTRFSRSRTLDVPTTSSSAWTGPCPPSSIRRFQAKSCDGETPACRATEDTLIPGCIASPTRRTFSAVDHRRRRCTEVITSTRENGPSGAFDTVVLIGGCLCLIGCAPWPVKTGCAPIEASGGAPRRGRLSTSLLSGLAEKQSVGRRFRLHAPSPLWFGPLMEVPSFGLVGESAHLVIWR